MNFIQRFLAPRSPILGGEVVLQSKLSGTIYRPKWNLLSVDVEQRLRHLLAINTDVTELARAFGGSLVERGVLSTRVVTTAGVTALAAAFAGTFTISNFKYHGFGTGTNNEGIADVALQTELTTQYALDSTRPTGSQSSTGGVYTTIGTLAPDTGGVIAITEHGLFSATSAGTLWDRSKFAVINLTAGQDSLQVTYELTLQSGG